MKFQLIVRKVEYSCRNPFDEDFTAPRHTYFMYEATAPSIHVDTRGIDQVREKAISQAEALIKQFFKHGADFNVEIEV